MGNTCKPMAVSFQCMTTLKSTTIKSTTIKKKRKKERNMETELWRRKKEWLCYFARQRGNTVGSSLKNLCPLPGE